jgi:hypothetical protein
MVVAGLGVLVACGLDVLATGETLGPGDQSDASTDGPGADALRPADSPFVEGSQIVIPPLPDPFLDAGLDVNQANCLDGCDGGSCDAGWCVLDCVTTGTCTTGPIACPPTIPCEVHCGVGSCTQGVDCTAASACRIDCAGAGSCTNQPVACSGLACQISCAGAGSCTKGVNCDAGACTIGCTGNGTCTNEPVTCNASTCSVRCGVGGEVGRDSCSKGVTCDTARLCDIGCVARDVCRDERVSVRSDGTSIVQCTAQGSCNKGSVLSGREAGVLCGPGNGACGADSEETLCDAGKCAATCDEEDFTFCCKGGAGVCDRTTKNCTLKTTGCPP